MLLAPLHEPREVRDPPDEAVGLVEDDDVVLRGPLRQPRPQRRAVERGHGPGRDVEVFSDTGQVVTPPLAEAFARLALTLR